MTQTEAQKHFTLVQEAWEVLRDSSKRNQYDRDLIGI